MIDDCITPEDAVELFNSIQIKPKSREPTIIHHEIGDYKYDTYHCPVCGWLIGFDDYYCKCGQKLR